MNKNIKRFEPMLLVAGIFWLVVFGVVWGFMSGHLFVKEERADEEWCQVGVWEGGKVTYVSDKRQEDLLMIARSNGQHLLMAKCE